MRSVAYYLTHPEVEIDADVPVPSWGLSDVGRRRARAMATGFDWHDFGKIVSSAETKAVETAEILSAASGLPVEQRPAMHENDRSSTGYLPASQFEAMADRFFGEPDKSVEGWERAVDAQTRIVAEVEACLAAPEDGDLLFVGHGAVGTLLYCALGGFPISRAFDQKRGGSVFAFEISRRRPLGHWQAMEALFQQRARSSGCAVD